jgi:hypothetical protein
MKTNNDIYIRLTQLNKDVKDDLKRRGLVVPIKKDEDTIQLDKFLIKKIDNGFYNILNIRGNEIVHGINLPQTAVILANKLALGKWLDLELLQYDKKYGFAMFDELVHKRSIQNSLKKKEYDRAELMQNKYSIAKHKRNYYKKLIINDYQKLLKFR